MKRTCFILCAGTGNWGHGQDGIIPTDLGDRKFLRINGEHIVSRTVRLLRERLTEEDTVYLVTNLEELSVEGSQQVLVPEAVPGETILKRFLQLEALWEGDVFILYGDVYFTEDAIGKILSHRDPRIISFGRPRASTFTGKSHGDYFAEYIHNALKGYWFEKISSLQEIVAEDLDAFNRCWEALPRITAIDLHNHIHGLNLKERVPFTTEEDDGIGYFETIDDYTEDFDFLQDYWGWEEQYAMRDLKKPWLFK